MEKKKEDVQVNIEELKKKHKVVFSCDIKLEDGTVKRVHFCQPTRSVMGMAAMKSNGNPIRYNEIVLDNCLIGDDKSILKDDSIFYGLSQNVDKIVNATKTELKKL